MKKKSLESTMEGMEADGGEELHQHEIDRHVNTLHEAEKIKGDSGLMKKLAPHIEKHKSSAGKITSLSQLKAVAKKKMQEPDEY